MRITENPAAYTAIAQLLHAKYDTALIQGMFYVREHTRVDTSSLRESANADIPTAKEIEAKLKAGGVVVGSVWYGGTDFSGQIMPDTGVEGRDTSVYVEEQEERTNALLNSIDAIAEGWKNG